MRSNQILSALGIAAAGFVSLNCASDPSEPPPVKTPTTVTASGNSQTGTVGAALAAPIGVTVLDQDGDPMSGVVVTFAVTGGGGTLGSLTATSNSSGVATTTWTLGTVAGTNNNTATATVPGYAGAASVFMASANTGAAALLRIPEGNNQGALISAALPSPLEVTVSDAYFNPVAGVNVAWAATTGGGSVSAATVPTDALGHSSVTRTLGGTMGGNGTTAAVPGLTPALVTFTSLGTAVASTYTIQLQFLSTMTASQASAFTSAAARWSSIVVGDQPDDVVIAAPGDCGSNSPALDETIDDNLIFATIAPIDGPGGILGGAGPCFVRIPSYLTIVGFMTFDVADMAFLEANGILVDVILHEMGHVLGVGSLWTYMTPSLLTGDHTTGDPYFNGATAISQFNTANVGMPPYAGIPVPVEATGGAGTWDSHWRESVMGRELMTGYISAPPATNPLSAITIGSLADMAYTVNYTTADAYTVSSLLRAPGMATDIHLREFSPTGPIRGIDRQGRITRVR
jgi:hypothetical protein